VEKFISENSRVTGVRLVGGETIGVRKAVIGMIHPWLLPEMVDGLEDQLVANAKGTTTASFAIMAGHYALEEPPQYHAGPEPGKAALVNFAPARMEQFLRIFDDFRYGDILQKDSIMAAHEHTQFDPGLAPPGKATYTVFGFAPFELRDSGADGWDRHCDDVGDWLTAQLHHYIPNMEGGNILASLFESPLDMRRRSPTFQGADVGGVGKYLHQFGGHRPTPELAQFAVPGADGLYLAGTFMHPAGGVTGGGRATAVKICDDLGIDFDGLTR
jgi:phytoene dehydrogenase-like protein